MPEYTIKREDIMVMFNSLVSHTDQGTNQADDVCSKTKITKYILIP